jgi:hypothetical protein
MIHFLEEIKPNQNKVYRKSRKKFYKNKWPPNVKALQLEMFSSNSGHFFFYGKEKRFPVLDVQR